MPKWNPDGNNYTAAGTFPGRQATIRPEARGYGWEVTQDGVAIASATASILEPDPDSERPGAFRVNMAASLQAAKEACIEHLEREHTAA